MWQVSMHTLIQICLLLCVAMLSPALAFLLFAYLFILAKMISPKRMGGCLLIIGLILIVASLRKFNYQQLVHLYSLNLQQLYSNYLIVIHNSFTNFRANSIDNGLAGLSGIYLLISGIISLCSKAPRQTPAPQAAAIAPQQNNMHLGLDSHKKPCTISYKELNQHTLVIGTTGSGKTGTLLNIVYNCCEQNLPLIYLDGKGSTKLVAKIGQICEQFGRTLKVFSIDPTQNIPHLAKYNPLAYGNFTQWKNKIVTLLGESENRGQEHYALEEQSYINLVCEILYKSNKTIDIEVFLAYLAHPTQLQKLANLQGPEIALRLLKAATSKSNDIVKTLELLYYSHYGDLLSTSGALPQNIINLQQAILHNEIVLFLFDAASFKRDTSQLGRLVINDINCAFAEFGKSMQAPRAFCIFDEFAAYASPNMSSMLAMQRDNGMHAIISTQSIRAISEESQQVKRVAVELIANCNTFIIHKINDPYDIKLLQETLGQESRYRAHSINVSDNKTTAALKPEYILDGNKIRGLKPGFGYVCRTVMNLKPQIVEFNYRG